MGIHACKAGVDFRGRAKGGFSMDRDATLSLVRTLTQPVLELFSPDEMEEFDDDFADWALSAGSLGVSESSFAPAPPGRNLDTMVVAGMFFQVMMEASRLPGSQKERVSFVRKKAKDYLVTQLAGKITLSQFYRLLNLIEEEVGVYFAKNDWSKGKPKLVEASLPQPRLGLVNTDALGQALDRIGLPEKGRRKITSENLAGFLRETEGRWFRVLDFETRFQVNKKTAWAYLNLLLEEGILVHNGEKANRVRYSLAGTLKISPTAGPAI
jgi:alkylated DNA nucleotide flippase Atl1